MRREWYECSSTYGAAVGSFSAVYPHVNDKLVSGVERLLFSYAILPETDEWVIGFSLIYVNLLDVPYEVVLLGKHQATAAPFALVAYLGGVLGRSRAPVIAQLPSIYFIRVKSRVPASVQVCLETRQVRRVEIFSYGC